MIDMLVGNPFVVGIALYLVTLLWIWFMGKVEDLTDYLTKIYLRAKEEKIRSKYSYRLFIIPQILLLVVFVEFLIFTSVYLYKEQGYTYLNEVTVFVTFIVALIITLLISRRGLQYE